MKPPSKNKPHHLNKRALKSLHGYIEMMWREEYSCGYYNLAADLRRLMFVLDDMRKKEESK